MGTITAGVIIDAAAKILVDDTKVFWPEAEMLGWASDGEREICLGKPDAFVVNQTVALVAGTKQSLPAGGNVFVDLRRNMGLNGTTPGRAPRMIPLRVLNEQNPNWHADPADGVVKHYAFDARDPLHYYVWPPQPVTPYSAEIVYGSTPPTLTAITSIISVSDLYKSALINYVLFRAYSKAADYAKDDGRAGQFYANFIQLIIGKTNGEEKNNPKRGA